MRILAVDDSPTMRRIVKNTLKQAGYTDVEEAGNGVEALSMLKSGPFDLILTDWNMPNMNGLEFVTQVRSQPETKSIPILMVTTRSVKEDILAAMKAGVNGYIVKPFTPATIKEKITALVK